MHEINLCAEWLDWIWIGFGLDWIGLDWIGFGLDWIGLGLDWDWIGIGFGLDWIGLDWIGLDWIGLDWIGLDWIGLDLDWFGLDWIGIESEQQWITSTTIIKQSHSMVWITSIFHQSQFNHHDLPYIIHSINKGLITRVRRMNKYMLFVDLVEDLSSTNHNWNLVMPHASSSSSTLHCLHALFKHPSVSLELIDQYRRDLACGDIVEIQVWSNLDHEGHYFHQLNRFFCLFVCLLDRVWLNHHKWKESRCMLQNASSFANGPLILNQISPIHLTNWMELKK